MGATGAAVLAREFVESRPEAERATELKGFDVASVPHEARSFECEHCPNRCEVVELSAKGGVLARWGSRCRRWDVAGRGRRRARAGVR